MLLPVVDCVENGAPMAVPELVETAAAADGLVGGVVLSVVDVVAAVIVAVVAVNVAVELYAVDLFGVADVAVVADGAVVALVEPDVDAAVAVDVAAVASDAVVVVDVDQVLAVVAGVDVVSDAVYVTLAVAVAAAEAVVKVALALAVFVFADPKTGVVTAGLYHGEHSLHSQIHQVSVLVGFVDELEVVSLDWHLALADLLEGAHLSSDPSPPRGRTKELTAWTLRLLPP